MEETDEVSVEAGVETPSEAPAEEISEEILDIEGLEVEDDAIASADEYAPTEDEASEVVPMTEEEMDELERQLDEELDRLNEEFGSEEEEEIITEECEEEEIVTEEETPEEEEALEEASMRSTTHLRHTNLKPTNAEKKADTLNEARNLYAQLTTEVNKLVTESKSAKAEVETEKAKNEELKKLNESLTNKLKEFKDKLYEASVITSKTAFVNRLFLEHTTTQDQKKSIVSAFGKAQSREEVKALYESYNTQLGTTILNEGLENKIGKVIAEGTNTDVTAPKVVHGVDVSRYQKIMNYKSN
jgi:hypothetical protein